MAPCLCPSHLISVPTPCLECVYASVHVLMSTWVPNSSPPPLHSYMETGVPMCGTVCMFQSVHFWSHTLFRTCTCLSTCIYVHLTPHVSSTPYGWLHGNLCSCMWHCVCPHHPPSDPTPWLKCVHASVHVYMSTWVTMSASPSLHSYIETWVLLYGTMFVSQSPHFWSHTLFRMCICISTCTYVNLSSKFFSTPFA